MGVALRGWLRTWSRSDRYKWDEDSIVETTYDEQGRVKSRSRPFPTSDLWTGCSAPETLGGPLTTYAYNPLGEVSQVTNPDTSSRTIVRNGLVITQTDENHHQTVTSFNAYGEVATVNRKSGETPNPTSNYSSATYAYDVMGDLTDVYDTFGNHTQMLYDQLGRKSQMTDPDMGTWHFGYDAAGRLVQQQDALGQYTSMTYDDLGRVTKKCNLDWFNCTLGTTGVTAHTFTYDQYDSGVCSTAGGTATNQLVKMTDVYASDGDAGTARWCYDERGRQTLARRDIGSDPSISIGRTYTPVDKLKTITYPDSEVATYTYDPYSGQASSLANDTLSQYVTGTTYKADFQFDSLQLGAGPAINYTYDSRGRTKTIVAGSLQNLSYSYDNVGNVTEVNDAVAPKTVRLRRS